MKREDIVVKGWNHYELLDSGEGRKLESFAGIITDRPDPQALWKKKQPSQWMNAQAQFLWAQKGERWNIESNIPETWNIVYNKITLELSFPGFKHVGIFPEHTHQWDQIIRVGKENPGARMLNLFGYTGGASIAGALSGMKVTHVDASKTTIATVKKNAILSGLPGDALRTVCEDALRYTKRLIERGEQFEVIVMDPPAFGRGPKGEVWKIEESLLELVELIPQIMSPNASLVILNGYASGYAAQTFGELLYESLPSGDFSYGDIGIEQKDGTRTLTTGIYAKWQK